jgi:hypothetical protein
MSSKVETLRAATQAKEISYKIAYGLPLDIALEWGLYVSRPRYDALPQPSVHSELQKAVEFAANS